MALKKCKECGQVVSSDAKVCPHCGKRLKSSGCGLLLLLLIILILLPYLVYTVSNAIGSSDNDKTTSKNKSETVSYDEIRLARSDGINIRKGPGTNYGLDESGQLTKNEKLYVLEEKDGWLKFRVTQKDVGWEGWVRKDLTVSASGQNYSSNAEQITALEKTGLIVSVTPGLNKAQVEPVTWNSLNYNEKEYIGKIIASYCAEQKGTNLVWADIIDAYTGKRIAKYSESWGFKVYD